MKKQIHKLKPLFNVNHRRRTGTRRLYNSWDEVNQCEDCKEIVLLEKKDF